ncbi:hypothetical protein KBD59_01900 [Candidatus Gracilibacteria bacterium]|nr:hypothetical protein [Candidatus Gracilibacteria bacterium]
MVDDARAESEIGLNVVDGLEELARLSVGIDVDDPESLQGFAQAFLETTKLVDTGTIGARTNEEYEDIERALADETATLKELVLAGQGDKLLRVKTLRERILAAAQNRGAARSTVNPQMVTSRLNLVSRRIGGTLRDNDLDIAA